VRLLALQLTDWKRFRSGPYELMFGPRATIVSGPNEAGKSTLFDAIRRALFDRSRSQARWVERLIPYGLKGAIPNVVLTFEHARRELRIRKAFGHKGEAELCEKIAGEWTAVARHEQAEETLLALLGAQACPRTKGSVPESWGAFQWLFVPQDQRSLPDAQSEAASRIGLDTAGVSPEFEQVRRLTTEAYDRSFTPTGKIASKSESAKLAAQVESLHEQRGRLDRQIHALDDQRRVYDDILQTLPQLRADVAAARQGRDCAEQQVADLSATQATLATAEASVTQQRERTQQAQQILQERTRRERDASEACSALEQATAAKHKSDAALQQLQQQLQQERARAKALGDRVAELRRACADGSACLRLRERTRAALEARARLQQATQLDDQILGAQADYGGEPPEASVVRELEATQGKAIASHSGVAQAALRVSIEGALDWTVTLDGSRLQGLEGVALRQVVVQSTSGAKITIEGDMQHARELREQADGLDRQIAQRLEGFGVRSLQQLRDLRETRLQQKACIEALAAQRLAVDLRTTPQLQTELASLQGELADLQRQRTCMDPIAQHDQMPDPDLKAFVRTLNEQVRELEAGFEHARSCRDRLTEQLQQLSHDAHQAMQAFSIADTKAKGAAQELDRHRDQHGSLQRCEGQQRQALAALGQAQSHLDQQHEALHRLEQDAATRRQTAQRLLERLSETLVAQELKSQQIAEMLERESAQGAYSEHAAIDRAIELGTERLARLERADRAIELLKGLMDQIRSAAVARVVAPISAELGRMLALATSGRYTLASLDAALWPRELQGAAQCAFDDGSEGLRELVAVLVRLSVASHLAAHEPQVLILDDPCVHVSRERTVRLVEILNSLTSTGRVQAVILTHRGQEFSGLEGQWVRVDEMQQSPSHPVNSNAE
jgi:DNA repair exonuclease SbcCD ATPase subunit